MITSHRPRANVSACALVLGLALMPGCGLIGLIAHKAKTTTVNMDKWDVQKIGVALHSNSPGICPRESVQLSVTADAVHKKRRKKTKTLETWKGDPASANRMGKMGFDAFTFTASNGVVDEHGYFHPDPDVLKSAATGFQIETSYGADSKLLVEKSYEPRYDCIAVSGSEGEQGQIGTGGMPGQDGANGSPGSTDRVGDDGSDGSPGGHGGSGTNGGPGPTLVAYATMVRTPYHDRLVAIRVTGDYEDLVLVDPNTPHTLSARGGAGGPGGHGGAGGEGGSGGMGIVGGKGGHGGAGGPGGNGGVGGPGGQLQLVYDAAFPELATLITLDVSGGDAGPAGLGGRGGPKGSGGSALGEGGSAGAAGAEGARGPDGAPGTAGPPGVAQAMPGDVGEAFASLPDEVVRASS